MIDGDGNVRITDFGIATAGGDGDADDLRHAAVHGARTARRPAGVDEERHLRARPDPVRDLHRTPRLRCKDTRRPEAAARHRHRDDAVVDRARPRARRRARHPAVSRSKDPDTTAGVRTRGGRGAAGRRSARRGAGRRRNAVAGGARRGRRDRRDPGRYAASRCSRPSWCRSRFMRSCLRAPPWQTSCRSKNRRPCSRTAPSRSSSTSATRSRRSTPHRTSSSRQTSARGSSRPMRRWTGGIPLVIR